MAPSVEPSVRLITGVPLTSLVVTVSSSSQLNWFAGHRSERRIGARASPSGPVRASATTCPGSLGSLRRRRTPKPHPDKVLALARPPSALTAPRERSRLRPHLVYE